MGVGIDMGYRSARSHCDLFRSTRLGLFILWHYGLLFSFIYGHMTLCAWDTQSFPRESGVIDLFFFSVLVLGMEDTMLCRACVGKSASYWTLWEFLCWKSWTICMVNEHVY